MCVCVSAGGEWENGVHWSQVAHIENTFFSCCCFFCQSYHYPSLFIHFYIEIRMCSLAFAFKTVTLANWNFRINEFIVCACTDYFFFQIWLCTDWELLALQFAGHTLCTGWVVDGVQECNVRFYLIHHRSRWFLFVRHCFFYILLLLLAAHKIGHFSLSENRFFVSDSTFSAVLLQQRYRIFRYQKSISIFVNRTLKLVSLQLFFFWRGRGKVSKNGKKVMHC